MHLKIQFGTLKKILVSKICRLVASFFKDSILSLMTWSWSPLSEFCIGGHLPIRTFSHYEFVQKDICPSEQLSFGHFPMENLRQILNSQMS